MRNKILPSFLMFSVLTINNVTFSSDRATAGSSSVSGEARVSSVDPKILAAYNAQLQQASKSLTAVLAEKTLTADKRESQEAKDNLSVFHALLAAPGIDVNKAAIDGTTPLYMAAEKGHFRVVRELLVAPGIDVARTRSEQGLQAPRVDVNRTRPDSELSKSRFDDFKELLKNQGRADLTDREIAEMLLDYIAAKEL